MRRKKGTKRGRRRARGPGGRGSPTKGHIRSSRDTPRVQPRARWEQYFRLPHRLSSTRKKYRRKREIRASLGSGKTTLDTKILASLLTRVPTESTLVDTGTIIIRFVHCLIVGPIGCRPYCGFSSPPSPPSSSSSPVCKPIINKEPHFGYLSTATHISYIVGMRRASGFIGR